MGKQKKVEKVQEVTSPVDRLGLRISTMMSSPRAQEDRRMKVYRLDTDDDYAWNTIMELIREADGVEVTENEDSSVTIAWEKRDDDDWHEEQMEEMQPMEEGEPF